MNESFHGTVFLLTSLFWVILSFCFFWNSDLSAGYYKKSMEYGEAVCATHDGFASSDHGGDFTCKNGVIIQRADAKPDKTGG